MFRQHRIYVALIACVGVFALPAFAAVDTTTADHQTAAANADDAQEVSGDQASTKTSWPRTVHRMNLVIVTASRMQTFVGESGRSVSAVTEEDFDRKKAVSIVEALRDVPGVRVKQLRGVGTNATLRIRGTRSFDTRFLLNGLPVRDASDPQGSLTPFVEDILLTGVQQLEVVRGSSSTLHGSEAIGGVVNIIPKQGDSEHPEVHFAAEGGSYGTSKDSLTMSGKQGIVDFLAAYTHLRSEGYRQNDAYRTNAFLANLGVQPTDSLDVRFLTMQDYSRLGLNDSPQLVGGVFFQDTNDPNDYRTNRLSNYQLAVTHTPTDRFSHSARAGIADTKRRFVTAVDEVDTLHFDSQFEGETLQAEYQGNVVVTPWDTVVFGYEYVKESLDQVTQDTGVVPIADVRDQEEQTQNSVYVENNLSLLNDTLNIATGGRYIDHELAGSDLTWEASAAYLFPNSGTRLHSHVGTGFRVPSLFELFGKFTFAGTTFPFGNLALDPEEVLSWDIGFDQTFHNAPVTFGATYFNIDYDKVIDFVAGGFVNTEGGHSRGVETYVTASPHEDVDVSVTYTYTSGRDGSGGDLNAVPRHSIGSHVDCRFLEKGRVSVDVNYRGDEEITVFAIPAFTSTRIPNDDYVKVDAVIAWALDDKTEIYIRGENVLGEDYNEDGFKSPGTTVYGGMTREL